MCPYFPWGNARSVRDNLLCDQTKLLAKQKEMHVLELQQVTSNANQCIEQLQKKCQCLTKLFEEVRSRYENRDSRQEDLNLISDLRQIISEQEKDLALLTEEKRFYQLELSQANFRRKGGGRVVLMHSPSPEFENARSRSHSPQSSPELKAIELPIIPNNNHPHRELEVIWESPDSPEEVFHVPRSKSIDMPNVNGSLHSAFPETASSI